MGVKPWYDDDPAEPEGTDGLELLLLLGLLAAICVLVPWLLVLLLLPVSWWLGRGLRATLRGDA